jgi:hypothetical protein
MELIVIDDEGKHHEMEIAKRHPQDASKSETKR